MAGGAGMGGNGSEVFNGATTDSTMTDNFGGRVPTNTAPVTPVAPADYYSTLARPIGETITNAYNQSLGRNPEATGEAFWRDRALTGGWTNQQLAQNIQTAGAPERAQSGFGGQINPQSFNAQRVATLPSYYNTNPVGVDYANVFNPSARAVTYNQPTMTPGQQADYLNAWQQDYTRTNRAATQAANQQRIATANSQWANYLNTKAQAEATTSNRAAIDAAVQEALAQQAQNSNFNPDAYQGAGGKAGGSVGIRSIK